MAMGRHRPKNGVRKLSDLGPPDPQAARRLGLSTAQGWLGRTDPQNGGSWTGVTPTSTVYCFRLAQPAKAKRLRTDVVT